MASLAALRVIVTRPQAQALGWVRNLQAQGCDAVALPLIDIAPVADAAPLQAAWQRLADFALVMFVSANAVEHFFAQRAAGQPWPANTRAGATGPGTTAALLAAGLTSAQVVAPAHDAARFDSEALWQQLQGEDWAGRQVLVVRGEEGRDWLADALRARGAAVDFVAAYVRRPPHLGDDGHALLAQAIAAPQRHLWHFSSSEAVGHLGVLAPAASWAQGMALATHPRIAQAATDLGFGQVIAVAPSTAAVVQWLAAGPRLQSRAP